MKTFLLTLEIPFCQFYNHQILVQVIYLHNILNIYMARTCLCRAKMSIFIFEDLILGFLKEDEPDSVINHRDLYHSTFGDFLLFWRKKINDLLRIKNNKTKQNKQNNPSMRELRNVFYSHMETKNRIRKLFALFSAMEEFVLPYFRRTGLLTWGRTGHWLQWEILSVSRSSGFITSIRNYLRESANAPIPNNLWGLFF